MKNKGKIILTILLLLVSICFASCWMFENLSNIVVHLDVEFSQSIAKANEYLNCEILVTNNIRDGDVIPLYVAVRGLSSDYSIVTGEQSREYSDEENSVFVKPVKVGDDYKIVFSLRFPEAGTYSISYSYFEEENPQEYSVGFLSKEIIVTE